MNPADARLIDHIQRATRGARMLLCTLAQRGKALERDEPERTAFLLTAARPNPLYKGGRLAFDMLEIEDLMLDTAPGSSLSTAELFGALRIIAGGGYDLAAVLLRFGTDGRERAAIEEGESASAPPTALLPRVRLEPSYDLVTSAHQSSARDAGTEVTDSLPELLASDYLYDYVVLGFLDVLSRGLDGLHIDPER